MQLDRSLPHLIELYQRLPRGGPGSPESTRRALAACALPADPRAVVMGCGVGQEVVTLAAASDAWIQALDQHAPFLSQLPDAVACAARHRVATVHGDLRDPPFEPGSQDLIWAENAVGGIGFARAVQDWRALLKPHGYLVISDTLWTTDTPSALAREHWQIMPAMSDLPTHLAQARHAGFEIITHFTLPETDWQAWHGPLEAALPGFIAAHPEPTAQRFATHLQAEITLRRTRPHDYQAVMFVLRR